MVVGRERELLTAESILSKVTDYDIYRYFVGEEFPTGRTMHSPMPGRKDNHPSFLIGNRGGKYYHRDFADSRYSGNCFQFVMQKEMLPNYYSALVKIDKEMGLGIKCDVPESFIKPVFVQPTIENESSHALFQVGYSARYTDQEKAYWQQYYITPKELEENGIFGIRWYMINRQRQSMKKDELTFGYKGEEVGQWKIYRPDACKRRKWFTNFPGQYVEGLKEVRKAESGIITKSRKDRIVLNKFLPQVVSTQNEMSDAFSDEASDLIGECWDKAFVGWDGDDPGIKATSFLRDKYPWIDDISLREMYLNEGITDYGDLIKSHGPQGVENFLVKNRIL